METVLRGVSMFLLEGRQVLYSAVLERDWIVWISLAFRLSLSVSWYGCGLLRLDKY